MASGRSLAKTLLLIVVFMGAVAAPVSAAELLANVTVTCDVRLASPDVQWDRSPPLPGARVHVQELGVAYHTDRTGKVRLTLPSGMNGEGETIFTFVITTDTSSHKTVIRRAFYAQSEGEILTIPVDPKRDLWFNNSPIPFSEEN